VSFDKVDTGKYDPKLPKGHKRVREVLDISDDSQTMQGYDIPHRHNLKYSRSDTGNVEKKS
jgi:hypothetical protein